MTTRAARTNKAQPGEANKDPISTWLGPGFLEAATRLNKAEELLHRCEIQSAEALKLAKAAQEKGSSKLNTKLNEMMEQTDSLHLRVKDLQAESDNHRSKLEALTAKLDAALDGMASVDIHTYRRAGTGAQGPQQTLTAEEGDLLARRVLQFKQERAKIRSENMLEELSEVSFTTAASGTEASSVYPRWR